MLLSPGFLCVRKSERDWKKIKAGRWNLTLISAYPALPEAFQIGKAQIKLFYWHFQLFKKHYVLMNALSRGIFCILTYNVCLLKPLCTIFRIRSYETWQLGLIVLFIVIFCVWDFCIVHIHSFGLWANLDIRIVSPWDQSVLNIWLVCH